MIQNNWPQFIQIQTQPLFVLLSTSQYCVFMQYLKFKLVHLLHISVLVYNVLDLRRFRVKSPSLDIFVEWTNTSSHDAICARCLCLHLVVPPTLDCAAFTLLPLCCIFVFAPLPFIMAPRSKWTLLMFLSPTLWHYNWVSLGEWQRYLWAVRYKKHVTHISTLGILTLKSWIIAIY